MWLGIAGGFLMALLLVLGVKGALIFGIAFVTIVSWIPGHAASYLGADSAIPGAGGLPTNAPRRRPVRVPAKPQCPHIQGVRGPCPHSFAGGQQRFDVFKEVVAVPSLDLTGLAWDWSAFGDGHLWLALFTFL